MNENYTPALRRKYFLIQAAAARANAEAFRLESEAHILCWYSSLAKNESLAAGAEENRNAYLKMADDYERMAQEVRDE